MKNITLKNRIIFTFKNHYIFILAIEQKKKLQITTHAKIISQDIITKSLVRNMIQFQKKKKKKENETKSEKSLLKVKVIH